MKTRRHLSLLVMAAITAGSIGLNAKAVPTSRDHTPNMNADTNSVLIPNRSPLISFRILFMTGSAADRPGKEDSRR